MDFDGSDHGHLGSSMCCIDDSQYGNWEASGHGNVVSGMKDWSKEMWSAQSMKMHVGRSDYVKVVSYEQRDVEESDLD